jgi:hypothetical protein
MSKKTKVLISVVVAMLVLAVGGTTMALAQEDDEPVNEEELVEEEVIEEEELVPELFLEIMPDVESDGLLERVAEILGISEEELREAFQEAREEMAEERFEDALYNLLDKAVEEDILTSDEAQDIKDWWEEKPEALNIGLLKRALWAVQPQPQPMQRNTFRFRADNGLHLSQLKQLADPELRQQILERIMKKGLITPEQAAKLEAWQTNRPQVSSQVAPQERIQSAMRGRKIGAIPQGRLDAVPFAQQQD